LAVVVPRHHTLGPEDDHALDGCAQNPHQLADELRVVRLLVCTDGIVGDIVRVGFVPPALPTLGFNDVADHVLEDSDLLRSARAVRVVTEDGSEPNATLLVGYLDYGVVCRLIGVGVTG